LEGKFNFAPYQSKITPALQDHIELLKIFSKQNILYKLVPVHYKTPIPLRPTNVAVAKFGSPKMLIPKAAISHDIETIPSAADSQSLLRN
jgi:hypothetical protein